MRRLLPLLAVASAVAVAALFLRSGTRADRRPSARTVPEEAPPPAPLPAAGGAAGAAGRRGATIRGTVVEESTGAPVRGARVSAFAYGGAADAATSTDGSGGFEVEATGPRLLRVLHPGFAPAEVAAAEPGGEPLRIALARGGAIAGRVVALPDRVPVGRYGIVAVRTAGAFREQTALLRQSLDEEGLVEARARVDDPRGLFRLSPLSEGKFALVVRPDEGWPGVQEAEAFPGGTRDVEIELRRTAPFRFEVVDATSGVAVPDVAFFASIAVDYRMFDSRIGAERGEEGAWRVALPVGEDGRCRDVLLLVGAEGYAAVRRSFSGWDPSQPIRIALAAAARVEGVVRGAAAEATVLFEREVDRSVAGSVPCDGTGGFASGPLPAGERLVVRAYDVGRSQLLGAAPLLLRPGETRRVELGAGPGAITVSVLSSAVPEEGALVALDDASGVRTVLWTDATGSICAGPLPSGPCTVFVNASREGEPERHATRIVAVEPGAPAEARFDFSREIRGIAVDAVTGALLRDLESVEIRARSSDGTISASTMLSPDGSFLLRAPAAAVYLLESAEGDRYAAPSPVRVDLSAATVADGVRLPLADARETRLVVRVIDAASGEPVEEGDYRFQSARIQGAGEFSGGRLEITDCGPGNYRITVASDRHAPATLVIELAPGERLTGRTLALQVADGVRILSVEKGSPGGAAGLREGDVVVAYGGVPVRNVAELIQAVAASKGRDRVPLELVREGKNVILDVPAGSLGLELENHRIG